MKRSSVHCNPKVFLKWKKDIKRVYEDQLLPLLINREIFRQFATATKKYNGTHTGAYVANWMAQGYVAFASTAIRRTTEQTIVTTKLKRCPNCGHQLNQKKTKPNRSVSLVILLQELKENTSLLTREWFCQKYKNNLHELAIRDFECIAEKKGATQITAHRIDKDIRRLEQAAKPIRRLANKAIAHSERDRRKIGKPKFNHIETAIATILSVYRRYRLLLEQKDFQPSDVVKLIHVKADFSKIWP